MMVLLFLFKDLFIQSRERERESRERGGRGSERGTERDREGEREERGKVIIAQVEVSDHDVSSLLLHVNTDLMR